MLFDFSDLKGCMTLRRLFAVLYESRIAFGRDWDAIILL